MIVMQIAGIARAACNWPLTLKRPKGKQPDQAVNMNILTVFVPNIKRIALLKAYHCSVL